MFYLLLAIASSTMVSVSMRLSEKRVKNDMGMFIANYLTCVLLSCAFLGSSLLTAGAGFGSAVLQGGFSGFLYLASLFFMQENMHHNGIVLLPQSRIDGNKNDNTSHQSQNGQKQKLNTDCHFLPPLFLILTYTLPQIKKMKRGNR